MIIILIYLFMVQSCKPAVVIDRVNPGAYNILLQESRSWPRYIYLLEDIACYERLQVDKPSYFTDFDTLKRVLNKEDTTSTRYEGMNAYLDISRKGYSLTYTAGKDKGKNMLFVIADSKQINTWNENKNQQRIRLYSHAVSDLLGKPYPANSTFRTDLSSDWKKLLQLTSKLNQKDFHTALENFKSKYLTNIEQ